MATKGQELHGPGVTLTILDLEPDRLVMQAAYDGTGDMPPAHCHPSQCETFTVLSGHMRTIVGGAERTYGPCETFDVPPGTMHQMAAEGGAARIRWEIRPPMRTAEFFETLYGGKASEKFLDEFKDEFRLG
jgi:quercetin dioxygenase-like cupin family protein